MDPIISKLLKQIDLSIAWTTTVVYPDPVDAYLLKEIEGLKNELGL